MNDIANSEQFSIQEDVLTKQVVNILEEYFHDKIYNEKLINHWISYICEHIIVKR